VHGAGPSGRSLGSSGAALDQSARDPKQLPLSSLLLLGLLELLVQMIMLGLLILQLIVQMLMEMLFRLLQ
jgi:hypothetical protein